MGSTLTNKNTRTLTGPIIRSRSGAAAATGAVEITLPVAIVAAAYIIGQAMVDAWGE